MNPAQLEVQGLHAAFDATAGVARPLAGVDLELRQGECFALVGESGCGKSLTALTILRLLPETGRITAGRIALDGEDLLDLPESAMRAVRGRRIAMIFQEPASALNPVLTIGRQVGEVVERHTALRGAEVERRVLALLDAVGIPDAVHRIDAYPFQLSGGLKQRVMIAAALAVEPEVLIADEPTTALDVTIQAQILDLLARLQAEHGMTLLLITHDLGVVARMAHRVGVMYAGQLVEVAPRDAFFRAPQHPYARKLLDALPRAQMRGANLAVIPGQVPPPTQDIAGCRFAARCDQRTARCDVEPPRMLSLAGTRQVRCHLREAGLLERLPPTPLPFTGAPGTPSRPASAPVLLAVRDLKVHFPVRRGLDGRGGAPIRAVDGVSFEIRAGQTLALVGESGCGKTTTAKAALRLIDATGGRIEWRPRGSDEVVDLTALGSAAMRRPRRALQIVFQDPYASLNPRMRVRELLAEGMRSLGVAQDDAARLRRIDALLEQVGLPVDARDAYPHEFSGGQRQRIAIARALAVEPDLIVCDEPTSALDVSVQAHILNLFAALQERLGIAYLFITHNLQIVRHLAHDVAVMYLGRIVEHGRAEEVLDAPRHPYTRSLIDATPSVDEPRDFVRLQGELPSPANPPSGCHFHPRCPEAVPDCARRDPVAIRLSPSRTVACLRVTGT